MNVSLTPELEQFIDRKVKSGRYNTASEVVRESLRLLEREDEEREMKLEELRREIMIGVEQIKNGEYIELESDEDYRKFSERIKSEGRKRLAAIKKGSKG